MRVVVLMLIVSSFWQSFFFFFFFPRFWRSFRLTGHYIADKKKAELFFFSRSIHVIFVSVSFAVHVRELHIFEHYIFFVFFSFYLFLGVYRYTLKYYVLTAWDGCANQ